MYKTISQSSLFFFLVIIIISLTSCTNTSENYTKKVVNGVEVIHNKNIPNAPDFSMKLTKLFEVQSISEDSLKEFKEIRDVELAENGNMFILDNKLKHILKYDNKGNFQTKFGGKGSGPGEFENVFSILAENDTLFMADVNSKKVIKYSLDGKLISDKKDHKTPVAFSRVGRNYLRKGTTAYGDGSTFNIEQFCLIAGREYNIIDTVYLVRKEMTLAQMQNVSNSDTPVMGYGEKIYLAENSANTYTFQIISDTGQPLKKIYKSYIRTKHNKRSLDIAKKSALFVINGEKKDLAAKNDYVMAINEIHEDKNGYIYVKSYSKDDGEKNFYDVFSAEGIYLNRIEMPDAEFRFIADKLILFYHDELRLEVYSY